jgi:Phage integrase family
MHPTSVPSPSIAAFTSQYDQYLLRVRGSAASTRKIHRLVAHRFLACRFPDGVITWSDLSFGDCAAFIRKEFARLPSHDTQRTWLVVLRSLLRYLADEVGIIPRGWDAALPKIANRRHAHLPRQLSATQVQHLFDACQKDTSRHLRDRAVLLVLLRLGLRREEVANLCVRDIDWRNGLGGDVDLRQARPAFADARRPGVAGRWAMTITTLSAYLEDFLAMKRVRAEVDARSGSERRQLRYTERLLRSFLEFWQARGCPWPIRAALALDWVAVPRQYSESRCW